MNEPTKSRMHSFSRVGTLVSRQLGRALAGPMAILILIPVLVCSVGLIITLTSWFNQRANVERLATQRFKEQADLARDAVVQALAQGDAVLGVLKDFVAYRGVDFQAEDFVQTLAGQFRGREVLAYLGIADPRGNYHGIFPDAHSSGEDRLVLTERRMQASGQTHLREYRIVQGRLEMYRDDPEFGYDPRTRPWYLLASRDRARVATDPYPWYDTGLIGVSVADPLLDSAGEVVAVVEIDFNLNSLSRHVEELQEVYGARILIHTQKGEVIAEAGLRQTAGHDREGKGTIPRIDTLSDPLFQQYFQTPGAAFGVTTPTSMVMDGEQFMAVALPIVIPGEADWQVICMGSLDGMLRTARDTMWQGVAVALVAMLIATVLALLFARYIVATHVRARRAERAAKQAREAMHELGAYRLCRLLGEGGMGEVWLAEHRMLARPVALKLIHSRFDDASTSAEKERMIGRFELEAQALAQLRSRNTIAIYDFGVSEDDDLFYVMELLDGLDLYALVSRFGPQPLGRVKSILLQAAGSLAEAHDRRLVHRDIKPANIFLCRQADEFDVVKVLDFGMVRWERPNPDGSGASSQHTVPGSVDGTPAYMAPEQAVNKEDDLGPATDLYALALVGWFLITSKHLFERENPMATLMAQVKESPPSLAEEAHRPIPEALITLLMECLAKHPSKRPVDMRAFVHRLEGIEMPESEQWSRDPCRAWWTDIPPLDATVQAGSESAQKLALRKRGLGESPASDAHTDSDMRTMVLP